MKAGELTLSQASFCIAGELDRESWNELALVVQARKTSGLTNSATSQAQIQGFKLTHPNIYLMNC